MIHLQQVYEDTLKDKKKIRNKRVKTTYHKSYQQKTVNVNRNSFHQRSYVLALSFYHWSIYFLLHQWFALSPQKALLAHNTSNQRQRLGLGLSWWSQEGKSRWQDRVEADMPTCMRLQRRLSFGHQIYNHRCNSLTPSTHLNFILSRLYLFICACTLYFSFEYDFIVFGIIISCPRG